MAYFVTIKIALRFHLSCAMRRNPSAPLLRRQANDREAVGSAEGFGAAEHPKARSKAHAPRQGRRLRRQVEKHLRFSSASILLSAPVLPESWPRSFQERPKGRGLAVLQ